jgi:hypothetical protein
MTGQTRETVAAPIKRTAESAPHATSRLSTTHTITTWHRCSDIGFTQLRAPWPKSDVPIRPAFNPSHSPSRPILLHSPTPPNNPRHSTMDGGGTVPSPSDPPLHLPRMTGWHRLTLELCSPLLSEDENTNVIMLMMGVLLVWLTLVIGRPMKIGFCRFVPSTT